MPYYIVEPEVAGELGPSTVYDRDSRPVSVTHLEYRFTNWLGDALVESTPCFIATEALAKRISREALTGVTFEDVTVTLSPEGEELIEEPLPNWRWLKLTGQPYVSDISLNDDLMLVMSDRALLIIQEFGLDNAIVEPAD
ncbi:hypothetical protein [Saccharopolyspora sp. 6M]|uniref:hypothetical protein n=1 Tax=Saccharopolyspora sp. 6M TaxID=2877237 RepID=UPI001CD5BD7E|nr:hypothetical protein [Saccharopolyspora sp. 6M]MCA1229554.1 hypothetical protein [Saccharopolyspora sp. 6M]